MKLKKLKYIFLASTLLGSTNLYAQQAFEDHAFKEVDKIQRQIDNFDNTVDNAVAFGQGKQERRYSQNIYSQIKNACRSNKISILARSANHQNNQIEYAAQTVKFSETLEDCGVNYIALDIPRNLQSLINAYLDDEIVFPLFREKLIKATENNRENNATDQYSQLIKNAKEYDISVVAYGTNYNDYGNNYGLKDTLKLVMDEQYSGYIDFYYNNESYKIPQAEQEEFYDSLNDALEDPEVQELQERQSQKNARQANPQKVARYILNKTEREKTVVINNPYDAQALSYAFSKLKVKNKIVSQAVNHRQNHKKIRQQDW